MSDETTGPVAEQPAQYTLVKYSPKTTRSAAHPCVVIPNATPAANSTVVS